MLWLKLKRKRKPNVPPVTFSFQAIGTSWNIQLFQEVSLERQEELKQRIFARIDQFDEVYSRFRIDSLITKMSKEAGTYLLPDDAKPLFDLYRDLYHLTEGRMTPLIGQTLVDAGYDAAYSLKPKEVLSPAPTWAEVLDYHFPSLTIKRPQLLDVGAAGKGYLVDLLVELLVEAWEESFCLDAGGDIVVRGPGTVSVALEDPRDTTKAIGIATINNGSICGSAGNRRAWGKYHHIIDPKTLTSPTNILAVWVMAKTGLLADALTTALFFVPPERLSSLYSFDYVILYENGRTLRSSTAPVELFLA